MSKKFEQIYNKSITKPEEFWREISDDIFWFKKPTKILNKTNPPFYKWFEDGTTNTCYNALDFHIDNGLGEKTALIYDSPITGNKAKFTYNELRSKVSKFAGALKNQGLQKGDRAIIYMPMVPEAVVAMLACGRIGIIHSVVFGGFASNELASRIDDSKAKILITASCGFEPGRTVEYRPLVDGALKLAKHSVEKVIFFQRKGHEVKLNAPKEISWDDALSNAKDTDCVEMNSNEYAYILYTSGTTGIPKGIVRDIGGHIVALKWTMKNVYNIDEGDVWWEGMTDEAPEHLIDWQGQDWQPDCGRLAAHPNARFTSPASQCPSTDPAWDQPEGVPLDALLFGGRMSSTMPLVFQGLDWDHGVYLAATIGSEATAASDDQEAIRRDPMAMLPFCGYNMGDYWNHWFSMADKASNLPQVFRVNWFRKGSDGKFLWPGFGQNMRVLKWIAERTQNQVEAIESPIGYVPNYEDLSWEGLDFSMDNFATLMNIDAAEWTAECESQQRYFQQFGDKAPQKMEAQRERTLERISQV